MYIDGCNLFNVDLFKNKKNKKKKRNNFGLRVKYVFFKEIGLFFFVW